jgi:N-acylglucosamine 2-epimerase
VTYKSNPSVLAPQRIDEQPAVYSGGLFRYTLPCWISHSVDREYGGFITSLNRDGTIIDDDKGMWQQGRFNLLLAHLYNTVEPRDEWLEPAKHDIDFICRYGFDDDGRMFFLPTHDGHPIRKRRYIFTETFGVAALAAYAKAANCEQAKHEAFDLSNLVVRYLTTPGLLPPKTYPENRTSKALAILMIIIITAQILRDAVDVIAFCNEAINKSIAEIERDFMKAEFMAVLESVGPNGELIDHFDGRILNPGHTIEAAWLILPEAKYRDNDLQLIKLGTTILDWIWQRGWDQDYGGIFYFRDLKGLPVQKYWHDMKFWWLHNETVIATLMAYQLTGNKKYACRHKMVHDWSYTHFPDPEVGEWFGYLHRDGRISQIMKGNIWKGSIHLPRMQLQCWRILEEMQSINPHQC